MKRYLVVILLEPCDPRYFCGRDGDEWPVAQVTSLEAAKAVQRLLHPQRTQVWDQSVQRHWFA